MNKVVLIIITTFMSGCVSIGDGMFVVSGEIVSHQGESCESKILAQGEKEPRSFNARLVSGRFSVDYTVAPHPAEYTIEVVCGSKLLVSRVIGYRSDIKPGGVVELGQI